MNTGNILKTAAVAGALAATTATGSDRALSAHELAYMANNAGELPIAQEGLDRLDAIASRGVRSIDDLIEPVDVNRDGTGTYRVTEPVGFIQYASFDNEWENATPTQDDTKQESQFYGASGEPQYRASTVGIGASPRDAIESLITGISEYAHVTAEQGFDRNWTERNGMFNDQERIYDDARVVSYANGVGLEDGVIAVEELRIDGNGPTIGYVASGNLTVYGNE